jgi:Chaperone of endosialidase
MAYAQQGNMVQSNYIVNLIELQNTVTNVSGLSPIQQVQSEVDDIMKMVNFAEKRIFTNIISKYDQSPIQVTDDINLSNVNLYQNGVLFVGSGGSGGGGGNTSSTVVSSGGTAIILNNTVSGASNAIAFDVGSRTVFSFDGLGRALYFDPSGTGDRFWVSSATLIADKFQTGADGTAAPGLFLQSIDVSGSAVWSYVSTLTDSVASVSISSGGVFFRTGTSVGVDAGRIDSNQNWYLGAPALVGNNDLVASNDVTVIGGPLRYQGAGTPIAGQYLHIVDSLGNVGLSTLGGGGLSSFVVGDQIQSGSMSVTADGPGQNVTVTSGVNEIARFTAAGFLGLSNATPTATLDVNGSTILNGPLTIQPGSGGTNYVFTSADVVGTGAWAEPLSIFSGSGVTLNQWAVNPGLSAVQGFFGSVEKIRFSTGGAFFGTNGSYQMDVSGIIAASGYASRSPLRFFIGANGSEVARFADNGNMGIGTSNPTYKLTVAGTQSNSGAMFVTGNFTNYGTTSATLFNGNGASITNIQTNNVGSGSNRLDIFETTTRSQINSCQLGISSVYIAMYSTLYAYDLEYGNASFSTLSSYLITTSNALSASIIPAAGGVVSSYSTSIGIATVASYSTLSSYIQTNAAQISTLSSSSYAYASTIAFTTASTLTSGSISSFLSTGGIFTGDLWLSTGSKLAIGYKTGLDVSGALDISGLIYTRGIRGIKSPFSIGVGTSTTTQLIGGGYSAGSGWRYTVQGDIDISGLLYRNGQLYTVNGTPANNWSQNGSNIWYADGYVGIGVTTPSYPLDIAGRIRCFGVDVIQGAGPGVSTGQGVYVSPWVYQTSNIYYNLGGMAVGTGLSSVRTGVFLDVSGPVRIRNGATYMSTLGVNVSYGNKLSATTDISGSLRAKTLKVDTTGVFGGSVTATAFLTSSDRRFKENISEIQDALGLVENLQGVRFQWKNDGRRDIGLIAQNVSSVVPEALGGNDTDGYTVAYDKIVPLLVQAVKVLAERVDILERRHR